MPNLLIPNIVLLMVAQAWATNMSIPGTGGMIPLERDMSISGIEKDIPSEETIISLEILRDRGFFVIPTDEEVWLLGWEVDPRSQIDLGSPIESEDARLSAKQKAVLDAMLGDHESFDQSMKWLELWRDMNPPSLTIHDDFGTSWESPGEELSLVSLGAKIGSAYLALRRVIRTLTKIDQVTDRVTALEVKVDSLAEQMVSLTEVVSSMREDVGYIRAKMEE